ncbi:hypothetical protein SAMN05421505_13464 [Sinosporangium album]|uniref:Uncharacterized protein n=1 Tax=Sinosporangium album TaxID=504805 RepID=A0A1G8HZQ4_9ACTN|nr:DUF6343 family protein [Sinosporangium album]SDI11920.1 hypothetical protein SAMN05421505_13464 [Sinosporangium album]
MRRDLGRHRRGQRDPAHYVQDDPGPGPGAEQWSDRIWSQISPTGERPRSAIGLRVVLACFGFLVCTAFAVLSALLGWIGLAVLMGVLAVIALADLAVLACRHQERRHEQERRRERR